MSAGKRSKKANRAWMHQHLTDPYVRQAQKDGYRARAAYKLQEIDAALHLIQPGQCVIDLGSAPGAWSQYVARKLQLPAGSASNAAVLIAIDLLHMEPVDGVQFVQGDFREDETLARLGHLLAGRRADVVLSDMAPNLSGIASADAARAGHLVELAVDLAATTLQPHGNLVAKVFHGSGYSQLVRLFKDTFEQVKVIKPQASRSRSAETYLVGRRLREPGTR
ncbi:MAG: RlmE family RNA methyltransferase [Ottowia sp.]|nr:RlmE family RNA methyltransferase [Ottowia sp.]